MPCIMFCIPDGVKVLYGANHNDDYNIINIMIVIIYGPLLQTQIRPEKSNGSVEILSADSACVWRIKYRHTTYKTRVKRNNKTRHKINIF